MYIQETEPEGRNIGQIIRFKLHVLKRLIDLFLSKENYSLSPVCLIAGDCMLLRARGVNFNISKSFALR